MSHRTIRSGTTVQFPCGWEVKEGIQVKTIDEMKWIQRARELREAGESMIIVSDQCIKKKNYENIHQ